MNENCFTTDFALLLEFVCIFEFHNKLNKLRIRSCNFVVAGMEKGSFFSSETLILELFIDRRKSSNLDLNEKKRKPKKNTVIFKVVLIWLFWNFLLCEIELCKNCVLKI